MFNIEDELHTEINLYKNLLKKYIDHIGNMEGVYFIAYHEEVFNKVELKILHNIVKELHES